MYGLPPHYTARTTPAYFNDVLPDSAAWQADVYRLAAALAISRGVHRLVDLGCGRGEKLIPLSEKFQITGVDYGANIEILIQQHPEHHWVVSDLNTMDLQPIWFENSVVICADVIEHLPTPDALLQTLKNACQTAAYVLVSTPDRHRIYKGEEHYGPPGNPYHCREWSNTELYQWFKAEGLPVKWNGWTISNDARPDQVWTSLLVMSQYKHVMGLPSRYESAEWNPVLE